MTPTHEIIKWINRIVLSVFLLLILLGLSIDNEIFIYAIFFTIFIGISQFLSAFILSFKPYKEAIKKKIRIYIILVIFYLLGIFISANLLDNSSFFNEDSVVVIFVTIPVLLLIYFSYLTETIR